MKAQLVDISETRKSLVIEIPSAVVDQEVERLARRYGRTVRVPGFRPGKVPPRVARQRFREQILHDVAHELIPKAIDDALRERGLEPVSTPDVTDVVVEQGQPLTFKASFETLPPIEPGEYRNLLLRRFPPRVGAEEVGAALEGLRARAARTEPVTGRGVAPGDIVKLSIDRRALDGSAPAEHLEAVQIEVGGPANPPGFDQELLGLEPGAQKTFTITYPADYPVERLAGRSIEYAVVVQDLKQRILPDLDDEFARDLEMDTLDALRARVREDLEREAQQEAASRLRADLLRELASRFSAEVPQALVARELDRRTEELVRRLIDQRIDPRTANIDWEAFRESQREQAADAVRSTLVLDEIARRENITVTDEDLAREIARYAARTERAPAVVRAQLEKDGGLARLRAGLRREKTIDFLLAHATIADGGP